MFLILTVVSVSGQNFAVRYWGTNDPYIPTNWPRLVQPIGTNTFAAGADAVMTQTQLDALNSSLRAQYDSLQSTKSNAVQTAIDANIASLKTAYSNLQWAADNFDRATNVTNLRIAVKACGDTLLKLKPVLVDMYKGE